MSMHVFYMINFILTLLLYTLLTVGVPALILNRKLSGYSAGFRFLLYITAGNFFICSLVIVLELMHICNGVTLVISTVAAAAGAYIKIYKKDAYSGIKKLYLFIVKTMTGRVGFRTSLMKLKKRTLRGMSLFWQKAAEVIREKKTDIILMAVITVPLLWRFGCRLTEYWGNAASDIVVHNSWINGLDSGVIYSSGIYPNGFHCIVYYLHAVFRIDVYVLLGIFWLVQLLFIHIASVFLLKICCKNRYLPYLLPVLYTILTLGITDEGVYSRFFASLPQEFGMIFIIPAIYFMFYYLRKPDVSWVCLAGFAMSLSMTVTVHFYDTIVLGIFCVSGAAGYGFRIFRKKYLPGILKSGLAGSAAAFFPMIVAYVTGTRLQGSLTWGLGVMSGTVEDTDGIGKIISSGEKADGLTVFADNDKINKFFIEISYIFKDNIELACIAAAAAAALIISGILILIFGDRDYGARNITVGSGVLILICIITAKIIGIPQIMEKSRCYTYFSLFLTCNVIMLIDTLLYVLPGRRRLKRFYNGAAAVIDLGAAVMAAVYMCMGGLTFYDVRYETNEAVICLANIIHDNKDNTWTICSANDEREMAGFHGRHYELINFLHGMENDISEKITIPTEKVYFFVEKKPIDYWYEGYDKSGQKISPELAGRHLPDMSGSKAYQLENRCIVMSRLYFWAQEYMKMYPNEMKTYYETDDFVCYCIEQNTNSLYNLAIDYGYNCKAGNIHS